MPFNCRPSPKGLGWTLKTGSLLVCNYHVATVNEDNLISFGNMTVQNLCSAFQCVCIDGNSILNRQFYGIRFLSTKDGFPTNAIFGFVNVLLRQLETLSPDYIAVAFDLKAPTFRHLAYEGYKATRKGMPEELAMQMPVMKDVLRAMNIPIYECQGWEADDIIGTVGKICSNNDWECVIVTGDRDSLQLIDQNVHVKLVISKPGQTTATLYTEEKFREEYGFEPKKLIDLKALMGDSSDNIPGVKGIGEKTAKGLMEKFGSLDGVYANLEDKSIRPKLREKLEQGKEKAYLSYDLALAGDVAVIREYDILVVGVERDEAVAAEFLEKSLAIKHEDSKLALGHRRLLLYKKNVSVVIFRLHAVALIVNSTVIIPVMRMLPE